jgi:hypothetical protein
VGNSGSLNNLVNPTDFTTVQTQVTTNKNNISTISAKQIVGSIETLNSGDTYTLDLSKNIHILDFTGRTTNLNLLKATTTAANNGTQGVIYIKQTADSTLTINNYTNNFRFENNILPVFSRADGTRPSNSKNNIDILEYKVIDQLIHVAQTYTNLTNDTGAPVVKASVGGTATTAATGALTNLTWNGDSFALVGTNPPTGIANIFDYLLLNVTDTVGLDVFDYTAPTTNQHHVKITLRKEKESGTYAFNSNSVNLNQDSIIYNINVPTFFDNINRGTPTITQMVNTWSLYTLLNGLPKKGFTKSGNYTFLITAKDYHGNQTSITRTFSINDITKPVMTTTGTSEVSLAPAPAGGLYTTNGDVRVDSILFKQGFRNVTLYATSQPVNTAYRKLDSTSIASATILQNPKLFGLLGANGGVFDNDADSTVAANTMGDFNNLRVVDLDDTSLGQVSINIHTSTDQARTVTEGKYVAIMGVEAARRLREVATSSLTLAQLDVANEIIILRIPIRIIDVQAPIITLKNYDSIERLEVKEDGSGNRFVVPKGSAVSVGGIDLTNRWAVWKDDLQSEYLSDSIMFLTVGDRTGMHLLQSSSVAGANAKSYYLNGSEVQTIRLTAGKTYYIKTTGSTDFSGALGLPYISISSRGGGGGTAANGYWNNTDTGTTSGGGATAAIQAWVGADETFTFNVPATINTETTAYLADSKRNFMGCKIIFSDTAAKGRGGFTDSTTFNNADSQLLLGNIHNITAFGMLLDLDSQSIGTALQTSGDADVDNYLQPKLNRFSLRANTKIVQVKHVYNSGSAANLNPVEFNFADCCNNNRATLSGVAAVGYFIADEGINNWLLDENLWETNPDSFLLVNPGASTFDSVILPTTANVNQYIVPGVKLDKQLPRSLGRAFRFFEIEDNILPTCNIKFGSLVNMGSATTQGVSSGEYINKTPVTIKYENRLGEIHTLNLPDFDSSTFNDNEDNTHDFPSYFNTNAKIVVLPQTDALRTKIVNYNKDNPSNKISLDSQTYVFDNNTIKIKELGTYKIKYEIRDDYHRIFNPFKYNYDSFMLDVVDEFFRENNTVQSNVATIASHGIQLSVVTGNTDPAVDQNPVDNTGKNEGFYIHMDSWLIGPPKDVSQASIGGYIQVGDGQGIDSSTIRIFAYNKQKTGSQANNYVGLTDYVIDGINQPFILTHFQQDSQHGAKDAYRARKKDTRKFYTITGWQEPFAESVNEKQPNVKTHSIGFRDMTYRVIRHYLRNDSTFIYDKSNTKNDSIIISVPASRASRSAKSAYAIPDRSNTEIGISTSTVATTATTDLAVDIGKLVEVRWFNIPLIGTTSTNTSTTGTGKNKKYVPNNFSTNTDLCLRISSKTSGYTFDSGDDSIALHNSTNKGTHANKATGYYQFKNPVHFAIGSGTGTTANYTPVAHDIMFKLFNGKGSTANEIAACGIDSIVMTDSTSFIELIYVGIAPNGGAGQLGFNATVEDTSGNIGCHTNVQVAAAVDTVPPDVFASPHTTLNTSFIKVNLENEKIIYSIPKSGGKYVIDSTAYDQFDITNYKIQIDSITIPDTSHANYSIGMNGANAASINIVPKNKGSIRFLGDIMPSADKLYFFDGTGNSPGEGNISGSNLTTDSFVLLTNDSLILPNFTYNIFVSATDQKGLTDTAVIKFKLIDQDRARINGFDFNTFSLNIDKDGTYKTASTGGNGVTVHNDSIMFPVMELSDSTLQFLANIHDSSVTNIKKNYLQRSDGDYGLNAKLVATRILGTTDDSVITLDSLTVLPGTFINSTDNDLRNRLPFTIKFSKAIAKRMLKASGTEKRVFHTQSTYEKSLKLELRFRDLVGQADSRIIAFNVKDETPSNIYLYQDSTTEIWNSANNNYSNNLDMELTSRKADGTFVPITFSGICDSFNFIFSAHDNHDTNGDSVVYQDSTGTALLKPGLMFDSHISNAFGDVTTAFTNIQNKGDARNKIIFSKFSDSAGTETADSFIFMLRTYRSKTIKVIGQSNVSGSPDSQIVNVDIPIAGSGLRQRFQDNLYNAFRGVGTFGQAGYKVGAFRDPYGIRADSTLVHKTDYEIDSTTVNIIRDELVASARTPAGATARLVKGPYQIKYKYLNAIDSVFLTDGTKKMLNQTDSFIIKVNTVDNSAPTIIFDRKLNTNGNVTRRFLSNGQFIGDSVLSGSAYKYHQVALGTRIYDILGLQATTNNVYQDSILNSGAKGPTFQVTENSNDAVRLKIYINKQDVVFSKKTIDSVSIVAGNNGFLLGTSATTRDFKNDKWGKGADIERQLLAGQTVASNMININKVIDTSGDSYSLGYSTGNNAIRFNKEGLCEIYFQVQDAQKNVHDPTLDNTATNAPFQMFKIVEKRAAYILLNKTNGNVIEVPGRTNGDDQDTWYDNNADLLDTSAAIQDYASAGQVPIRDYNDSRFAYSANNTVLRAGEMFIDILNPNYIEPGVTIRTLTPRMDTNDRLNSNGNGFAFRLPIDIRVIKAATTANAAYPNATTTINTTGTTLPLVVYDPNPNTGSDVELYSGVENYFNTLANDGNNLGTYYVEYKVTDVKNQYNKIYRRINVTQRHPTFTSTSTDAKVMARAIASSAAANTVLTTGITVTPTVADDEITSVTFNKNNCNIDLSAISVGGFTDNAGANNLAYSYKIMTKSEYKHVDSVSLDVEYYDIYNSTSNAQVDAALTPDSGNSSVTERFVPSSLLDNLNTAISGNFLASNTVFNGKDVEDELYMVIRATDTDSVMMAMANVNRLSKPIIIRFKAKLNPHVYLLGQDSVSIIQHQSYIDRYVHIVDPLSTSSEFKKYNTDLAITISTPSRIAWANPVPEEHTQIETLANSASGTKIITYTYTPSGSRGGVVYKEYNGGSVNDSATSGKLQREVTVVASNSAR